MHKRHTKLHKHHTIHHRKQVLARVCNLWLPFSCSACYLQNRRFFKYIGQSILWFCLSVCQSPTGHNLKPIFTKLHQVIEVASTEKPIDFEVKVQRSSWGPISKIIIFHPIDLKFEQHFCTVCHWTNYFWDQNVKGQLKVKVLKSSIFNWKIVNLHPINLRVEKDLHSLSLNLESNYFWGQRSTQG